MTRVFIIEDEKPIADLISLHIKNEGWTPLIFDDGLEGQKSCVMDKPDIIILDWMLPSLSGFEICKNIRQNKQSKNIPIIMLTALGEEENKISCLRAGADDYVVKPFSPAELIARIHANLRRSQPQLVLPTLTFENLTLNNETFTLTCEGKIIEISKIEFKLIQFFMQNPSRTLSRDSIMDNVWGYDTEINDRTVDVYIYRLRKKILNQSANCDIKSHRGFGYTLTRHP